MKKHVKESGDYREIHIMYRDGLFTCGGGQLENPTLWVVDCLWDNTTRKDKILSKKYYKDGMQLLEKWMSGCSRWNVVFLCLEGANVRFLVKNLEESHRIIRYGT